MRCQSRKKSPFVTTKKNRLLLAILALAFTSLACITSEISLKVSHQEDGSDQVQAEISQYFSDSWIAAAKEVNQQRKSDFAAAGRETDQEDLLPTTMEDAGDLFNPGKYQAEGYQIQTNQTGFTASRNEVLSGVSSASDWQVEVITDPEHPDQTTYRAKIWLDLTEMEGEDLSELRTKPQMEKPDLTPGATSTGSTGEGLGDLFSVFGDIEAGLEQQLQVELYYVQLALKKSDPVQYRFTVELPGALLVHKLNGETQGEVDGNRATLVLSEEDLVSYAGQQITFHVESILKDCSQACTDVPHMVWDEDQNGVSCNCVCEKGFEAGAGQESCIDCGTICSSSDPNLEANLAACELNQCACRCKAGYEMNNAGTRCVTIAEAEADDWESESESDPSLSEGGEEGSAISPAALYQDLEEYLAGEGYSAPTPGMMAVSGAALTSLLAAWLVLNHISGISPEQSLETIRAWSAGQKPPAEVGQSAGIDAASPGSQDDLTQGAPETGEGGEPPPGQRTPVQEGGEDQLVRHIRDVKDVDDAIKQTRKDFEAFEGRIPDRIKNSEPWKNHVAPHIQKIKDYIKKGELDKDKTRTWLDRVENLIKVREDVVKDLDYLSPDKQEAMVWTERTIKTLGHIASDTYQTVVIDPAKAAGENLLPSDLSKKWGDTMDELSQDISDTGQKLGDLPRTAVDGFTHKSSHLDHLGPQDEHWIADLHGKRDVPPDYPDFMGKGTRKVKELYNGAKNLLFGD